MIACTIGTIRSILKTRLVLGALLAAAALAAAGCRSNKPSLSDARYDGPPIQIDRTGRVYRLIMQAPTPGWTFTLDHVTPSLDKATVTVTARKPDPSYMYPQVIVTQELLTTVETSFPIDVYARTTEFVTSAKVQTYQFLGSSAP
ncbi:MAG: hypothetical protein KF902_01405 [Phycisphaeraceae bacterium]|nr:hypothetical protein [Phycisphaeraceae bacterium]